jgi:hypothetical protein
MSYPQHSGPTRATTRNATSSETSPEARSESGGLKRFGLELRVRAARQDG